MRCQQGNDIQTPHRSQKPMCARSSDQPVLTSSSAFRPGRMSRYSVFLLIEACGWPLAADSLHENSETPIHVFPYIRLSLFLYFLTYIYVGVWLAPAPRTTGPLVDAQQTGSSGRALRRDGTGLAGLSGGQVVKARDPHDPLWKLRCDLQGAAHGLDDAPQRADVPILRRSSVARLTGVPCPIVARCAWAR